MSSPVVFDIGNVLIEWDRRLLYRSFFADAAELERFLAEVYTLEANERFDRGQPLREFTASLAAQHPAHADAILALNDRWIETLGAVIDGTVAIMAELRAAGVPLFALSNFSAETYALIEPRYEFLSWFEGVVISGREGVIKPEPAIFERLCDRYGFAASAAVFVDDLPVNVAAAQALGFDGIVFTGADALRRELRVRGRLP